MAGDLGADAASAEAKVLAKILELLKEIIIRATDTDRKIKQEQLKTLKQQKLEKKYNQKLDKASGIAKAKYFAKCGQELDTFPVEMTPEERESFDVYAKEYNLAYYTVCNVNKEKEIEELEKQLSAATDKETIDNLTESLNKKKNEREKIIIVIRAKDKGRFKSILERMNFDIKREIDPESREDITAAEFKEYNEKSADEICQEIYEGKTESTKDFEDAVNMVADREGMEGKTLYLCDRNDPNNYIEVSYSQGENGGHPFTITQYDVYKNNEKQICDEFRHGEFTHYSDRRGNNSSEAGTKHWANMKKEMKDKSGFSDKAVVFKDKEDFEQYKNYIEKMREREKQPKEQEVDMGDGFSCKVYTEYLEDLREKTEGFELNEEGVLINSNTKQEIDFLENQVDCCKMKVMCEQLQNYEQLNIKNQELAAKINNYQNLKEAENFEDVSKQLMDEIVNKKNEIYQLEEVRDQLNEKYNSVSSVEATKDIEKQKDKQNAKENSLKEWDEMIEKESLLEKGVEETGLEIDTLSDSLEDVEIE